jgi:lipid A 3-O-deacylase
MIRKTAALAALWLFPFAAQALDSAALEAGWGDDKTSLLRIAVQDRWNSVLRQWDDWRLTGYWDFMLGVWDNSDDSTADIGITPVFSFERDRLYIEAAIGAHLVQRRISQHRIFSTAFQFGDHIGIGLRGREYDIGVAVQHLSNASIRRPNPGINFVLLRLQYHLR